MGRQHISTGSNRRCQYHMAATYGKRPEDSTGGSWYLTSHHAPCNYIKIKTLKNFFFLYRQCVISFTKQILCTATMELVVLFHGIRKIKITVHPRGVSTKQRILFTVVLSLSSTLIGSIDTFQRNGGDDVVDDDFLVDSWQKRISITLNCTIGSNSSIVGTTTEAKTTWKTKHQL